MAATAAAAAPPPPPSSTPPTESFLSPSLLGSVLAERAQLALALLCVEQFVAVFAPGVLRVLAFVQALVFPDSASSSSLSGSLSGAYDDDDDVVVADEAGAGRSGQPAAPAVLRTYARFVDDKRPTLGTKSDLEKLRTFGYNKFRYLSKTFIKRHNLLAQGGEGGGRKQKDGSRTKDSKAKGTGPKKKKRKAKAGP